MFWYLFLIAITVWVTLVRWHGRKLRDAAKQYRTEIPAWPLIGHSLHWIGSDEDRMAAFQKFGLEAVKQGGMAPMWLGNHFYLTLADPEAAEVILKMCLEKDQHTIKFIRQVTGDGMIFAPVIVWRPRRKILAPMFSPKNLNSFVRVFAKQSAVMVELLQPAANGSDFSIWKYIATYTFDAVCETNLGVQINAQKQYDHPFIDAFDFSCEFAAQRALQPWLHYEFMSRLLQNFKRYEETRQFMYNFVDEIIKAKRKELAQRNTTESGPDSLTNGEMKTFLEMLIDASSELKGFNDLQLREEALVILLAGSDTSAVGTSFTAVLLSRYPDEQAKVYEEIREVFGDSDRLLEADDLPKFKYLELFLKETLRLYPPVPTTLREVHNDFTLPSGKTLVTGMGIFLNIWGTHRNRHYWGEDVDQFRPERFLQPLKHPAQFIPFSHGMRNCLGYQYAMMSMKTVVVSLLRRYRILPPEGMLASELQKPLRVKFVIMMKAVDNFTLRLEPRH